MYKTADKQMAKMFVEVKGNYLAGSKIARMAAGKVSWDPEILKLF